MSNNPLQQYFRRPAIYFKLPSEGKYYPQGVVDTPPNGELPVFPMTSRDELIMKTPDAMFNGAALVSVIESCVPNIKEPWKLNAIDLEAIVVAIRAASVDGKLDIGSICPECDTEGNYSLDLIQILGQKVDIDFTSPLQLRDLEIYFRPLTYTEINQTSIKQFGLQRTLNMIDEITDGTKKAEVVNATVKEMNSMMFDVLTDTIASIRTPETMVTDKQFIREFLENCDSKTSEAIKTKSIELRQKNDTKPIHVKCENCGHEYTQPLVLNFVDFFA